MIVRQQFVQSDALEAPLSSAFGLKALLLLSSLKRTTTKIHKAVLQELK